MNRKWPKLAQQYETALERHVTLGRRTGLPLARGVGKKAAAHGLRALDLARLHQRALDRVGLRVTGDGAPHETDVFFAEAFTQLEPTGPSLRKAVVRLKQLQQTLQKRTKHLASSQRIRKQGVLAQEALKSALLKKTEHCANLLAESRDTQRRLQSLTRRILSVQEMERTTISRTLHEHVAQALLGIQVGLAHLKREAACNTTGLKKELTVTQRLVQKSAKTLLRFAGRLV